MNAMCFPAQLLIGSFSCQSHLVCMCTPSINTLEDLTDLLVEGRFQVQTTWLTIRNLYKWWAAPCMRSPYAVLASSMAVTCLHLHCTATSAECVRGRHSKYFVFIECFTQLLEHVWWSKGLQQFKYLVRNCMGLFFAWNSLHEPIPTRRPVKPWTAIMVFLHQDLPTLYQVPRVCNELWTLPMFQWTSEHPDTVWKILTSHLCLRVYGRWVWDWRK